MKALIGIISLLIITGCSSTTTTRKSSSNSHVQSVNQSADITVEKPLKTLEGISGKLVMPDVKNFDVRDLRRISSNTDISGLNVPPFVNAEIGIYLDQEPKIGERVTIVPLKVDIEPFQLSILHFEKQKNASCDNTKIKRDFYWSIDLERIASKEILEIKPITDNNQEFPFEVFTIYPAVTFARNMPPEELKSDMLPKGVTIFTIKGAIDLTSDKTPDLLYLEFCCKNKNESLQNCDYNCIEWYKKINGAWKLVDDAIPC